MMGYSIWKPETAMNYPVDASSSMGTGSNELPTPPQPQAETTNDLLRQILEIQKEIVGFQRAQIAAHDHGARWRAFVARWPNDFPELPELCKNAMPQLEKAYGKMILDLVERINEDSEYLENDFGLQEFLDRYGMRLAQIGTLLNLVGPLADIGNNPE